MEIVVILPNINGRGYGFFKITEGESSGLWSVLRSSEDEVLKGSLLITLYENLQLENDFSARVP